MMSFGNKNSKLYYNLVGTLLYVLSFIGQDIMWYMIYKPYL